MSINNMSLDMAYLTNKIAAGNDPPQHRADTIRDYGSGFRVKGVRGV
jgi:hypothetical protein